MSRESAIQAYLPFEPGDVIAERYRVVRFIAAGGMGEVYEVEDEHLGGRVALKSLRPSLGRDLEAQNRFKREIHLARRVTHANVCRLYDAGIHTLAGGGPPRPYLTMELLRGETLDEHLSGHGTLEPEDVTPLLRQMTAALDAAHDAGIVHRDFKSSNVILVPAGDGGYRAVVTDFGLARAVVQEGVTLFETLGPGQVQGTAAYMAPEQVESGETGPRTDVYALGVVLFQLVTGSVPFPGRSVLSAVVKRLREDPPSPVTLRPDLGERYEAVILRCLERDPDDRFASAGSVLEAWEGRVEVGRPSSKRRRWRPSFTGPLGTVAAALAVGLIVALLLRGGSSDTQPPAPPVLADPVQLTSDLGLEIDPTYSPDGAALAYAAETEGSFEIHLRALEPGSRPLALTDDGSDNTQPAFSPDGSLIAFASGIRGGIWVVPSGGGQPRRLTAFGL